SHRVVRPAPQDGKIAVEHRGSTAAERVLPLAQVGALPQFLAVVIEAVHPRRSEADDNAFGVEDRRSVAVPRRAVSALLVGVGDVLLPEQLAVGAGETEEAARASAPARLREKDPVPPDHRRRVAFLRQGDLPLDVHLVAPAERKTLLRAVALTRRTAPGRPVGGVNRGSHDRDEYEGELIHDDLWIGGLLVVVDRGSEASRSGARVTCPRVPRRKAASTGRRRR